MARLTIEEVKAFCKEIGTECISDNYADMKSNLKLICPECSEVYLRNFSNIKYRQNPLCSKCGRARGARKNAHSFEDVKRFIEVDSESGCRLISTTYVNVDSPLELKCQCGNYFKTTYYKFSKRGKRQCQECGFRLIQQANATPIETIKQMVEESGYTFLDSSLPGGDQRILVRCDQGHSEYWVNVSKFRGGQRCAECYRSLGEESIASELDKLNLDYVQEYSFDDLVGIGGGLLRYDFLVLNGKRPYLIEYDGSQHFKVAFGDEELLYRTQVHDEMKNQYAKAIDVPLYRIPYTDYERIPEIIQEIQNKQV